MLFSLTFSNFPLHTSRQMEKLTCGLRPRVKKIKWKLQKSLIIIRKLLQEFEKQTHMKAST